MSGRLVAVFGYSDASTDAIHPICAARLARAELEVKPEDAVLLSGWARWRKPASEADLMAEAWNGRTSRVLLDRRARTTFGNARGLAATVRSLKVSEVVLVTSGWHRRRAWALSRAALRGSGASVTLAATSERGTARARAREVLCWTLVPLLAAYAAFTR
jgi:uncharacterized SAM-binding protein YcdF (DUF218 family)